MGLATPLHLSAGVEILSLPDVTYSPSLQPHLKQHNTDTSSFNLYVDGVSTVLFPTVHTPPNLGSYMAVLRLMSSALFSYERRFLRSDLIHFIVKNNIHKIMSIQTLTNTASNFHAFKIRFSVLILRSIF